MDKHEQLGSWVRRFLLEHLIKERNLSPNTQRSYRDTLAMLLPFIAAQLRKPLDCLEVNDLSADRVRQFLAYLEQARKSASGPAISDWRQYTRFGIYGVLRVSTCPPT